MNFEQVFRFCPKCGSARFSVNDVKSKRCQSCGFVYYFNSAAAVAGFIEDGEGNLLLTRRAFEPAKGTLDLPGGFVDYSETAEEALKREVHEETGLQVQQLHYLFSIPNTYAYSRLDVRTLDLFFRCQIDDFSTMHAADDAAELLWVAKKEIQPEWFGLDSIRKATLFLYSL